MPKSPPPPRLRSTTSQTQPPKIAIIVSRYNHSITSQLLAGALAAHASRMSIVSLPVIVDASGAFELVALAHAAAVTGHFAGVVALGCIIRGETTHDQHLAAAVTSGLALLTLHTGIPVGLGVLTVNDARQAADRAGGKHGNKGAEAMDALLDTLAAVEMMHSTISHPHRSALPPTATSRDPGMKGRKPVALAWTARADSPPDKVAPHRRR